MYVCIYVCPTLLGMLIFHTRCVLEIQHVHHCISGDQCTSTQVYYKNNGQQTLPRMKAIVCSNYQGTTCSSESLRILSYSHSTLTVCPTPLLKLYGRCTCARHYCIFITLIIIHNSSFEHPKKMFSLICSQIHVK